MRRALLLLLVLLVGGCTLYDCDEDAPPPTCAELGCPLGPAPAYVCNPDGSRCTCAGEVCTLR